MVYRTLGLMLLLVMACKQKTGAGRFISETDTSFSQDIRDISKKINKDPQNPVLYYNRGNAFFYQDKFKDAVLDFDYAVVLDSANATYHLKLGETLLKLDSADSRKARLHLEKAVKLKPNFYEAQFSLAVYYIARQEYKKAEDLLKKLTGQADFGDKSFLYLGIISREKQDTVNAMVYFDKALQVNPQNYEAAMQVALYKAAQKDPKSLEYFNRVLAINEYSDEAYYGKGLFLQQQGKYEDALMHYEKARSINQGHMLAAYNIAVIYNLFEEYTKAAEMCNKVLDLDENFDKAYALRGFTYEKRNNKTAAIADYESALKLNPKNREAQAGLDALGVKNELHP